MRDETMAARQNMPNKQKKKKNQNLLNRIIPTTEQIL